MAPTTRSSGRPKSEAVSTKQSPKTIKKKPQAKKQAGKKPSKLVEADVEIEKNGASKEVNDEETSNDVEMQSSKPLKKKLQPKKQTGKKSAKTDDKLEENNVDQEENEKEANNDDESDGTAEQPSTVGKRKLQPKKQAGKKSVETEETKSKKAKVESEEDEDDEDLPDLEMDAETIYEFSVNDIDGNKVSLEKYKGNVCIIVNVASRCGHTKSNYEQFVELYDKYESKGLKILAFPCNQFGSQESGTCEKIKAFAENKGVKFDMFDKINVNGENASPLWKFLKEKLPEVTSGKATGKDIKWNFTKFIINKEGVPVERYASSTKPLTLVDSLEKLW